MATSTMTGGDGLVTDLSPQDKAALVSALNKITGSPTYTLERDPSAPPPNSETIYNPVSNTDPEGAVVTLAAGAPSYVEGGENDVTIVGNNAGNSADPSHPGEILAGNNGNDTFKVSGGSADIFTGTGHNTVDLTNGTAVINNGGGDVTVNLSNGNVIAKGSGTMTINGTSGAAGWYTSDSGGNVDLSNGTSINLGTGNDTITALGAATVYGGYDSEVFHGGTNSTFLAGQGNETLYGGTGATTFVGSDRALGTDDFIGGKGTNVFIGGNNRDTLVSGASLGASSDMFEFTASVGGGNHTIVGYSAGTDTISLNGYSLADVSSETVVNGNTVISLDDGTVITVDGVTDPSKIVIETASANLPAGTFNPNMPSTDGGQSYVPTAATTYKLESGGTAQLTAGSAPVTLSGNGTTLVGNNGADTFNLGASGGVVATGNGNDTINTTGGKVDVNTGAGADIVNQSNTDLTLYGSGDDTVNVTGTNNYLSAGSAHVVMTDGSAIQLGVGDDTITALGSATLSGGYNNIVFQGGTNSTVYAGSGIETLYGGSGTTDFYGSTVNNAYDSMVGGSGANMFVGGVNADTMVSGASLYGAAATDIFDFSSSVSGGNHVIVGFTASNDQIDLQGYTAGDVKSVTTVAGSSVISLDDGTTITLKGIAGFSQSSIHYT